LTIYHHWNTRVVCNSGVICRVGLLDIHYIFFIGSVSDGGKVTVTFVDRVILGGDGRVHVPVKLFDVRHSFDSSLSFTKLLL
jgi:hypothetical protein